MALLGLCVHTGACGWAATAPRRVGGWSAGAFGARDQLRAHGGGCQLQPVMIVRAPVAAQASRWVWISAFLVIGSSLRLLALQSQPYKAPDTHSMMHSYCGSNAELVDAAAGPHTAYAVCCIVDASLWVASGALAGGVLLAGLTMRCCGAH